MKNTITITYLVEADHPTLAVEKLITSADPLQFATAVNASAPNGTRLGYNIRQIREAAARAHSPTT